MTWGMHTIRNAYSAAERAGASHLIISHTNVDFDQTSTLVMPGEDPRKVWEESKAKEHGYDAIDEVYRLSLGWEAQAAERRAMHWEFEETK